MDNFRTIADIQQGVIDVKDGETIDGVDPKILRVRGLHYIEANPVVQFEIYEDWSRTMNARMDPSMNAKDEETKRDEDMNRLLIIEIRRAGPPKPSKKTTPLHVKSS